MISVEVGFDKINNPVITICCSVQWRNNVLINCILYLRVALLWTVDINTL